MSDKPITTVGDLIEALSGFDPETPVVTAGMDERGFTNPVVSTVTLRKLKTPGFVTGAVWDSPRSWDAEQDDYEGDAFTAVVVDLNEH